MRIVLLALFLVLSQAIDSCQAELAELTTLYILDKAKCKSEKTQLPEKFMDMCCIQAKC